VPQDTATALLEEVVALRRECQDLLTQRRLLELEVLRLKAELFGPRSEKLRLEEHQLPLLEEICEPAEPAATLDVVVPPEGEGRPARKPVRRPLPEHLEVVEERIEPAEKTCPHCGEECCVIREECSERLDLIPAKLIRRRTIRPVLACGRCKESVVQAPMPPQLIPKGLCGPGLLAHVLSAKFIEHRPLYRVQQELDRAGVTVSRATLCDWVGAAASALKPIYEALREKLIGGDYLQVDETPVRVLDPEVPRKAATGYLWVYARPGGEVLFDFRNGRSRAGPEEVLTKFGGTLQSDAYPVYQALVKTRPGLSRIGCLAHARRKFHEALEDNQQQALWCLHQIGRLYWIERQLRETGADATARLERRQAEAPVLWAALRTRLEQLNPDRPGSTTLPQSPLGKAVRYMLGEWEALQGYLRDGRFEIDNNLVENALRPTCVGKKNWLFIGHPDAGWRSAVLYTLIVSARRLGHDPVAYLSDVLRRLPTLADPTLNELLPENWKPQPA
jgi:transposase